VKNKVAPPFRKAEFDVMYGEGISKVGEIIDLGVDLNILKKSGSWFSYGETRLGQGRDAVKALIKDNPELMEYSDQHNLYPTNLQNANTPRSNLPLMDITGNVVFTYLEGSVGYNGAQMVYQPRASQKGNAARAIFYMATCYNGISGNNWKLPAYQDQTSLKNWHFADLPDNYEIARQEYIFSTQGNRNPYIDSVNFACHVSFSNMTYLEVDCNVGLEEQLQSNFSVFPVPSNGKVFAQVNGLNITQYTVSDLMGRVVFKNDFVNVPVLELNGENLRSGKYIIEVNTELGTAKGSFIIE
jgi:hypothetical protein